MAELATGAVSSLLGVIRNETQLLRGVRHDVQFIKEEMESMNSFLLHLARTAPPGGEHGELVRTWMNQVRLLAQDCNNCIDLYLYRGNPNIHLPRGGPQRYLWWAPWFLRKLIAQHHAAAQLRALKERARDVGKRRLRYGVQVPSSSQHHLFAAAGDGGDDDEDRDDLLAAAGRDHSADLRALLLETGTLDDFLERMLVKWMHGKTGQVPTVAIVAPPDTEDTGAIARKAWAVAAATQPKLRVLLVDIPAVHQRQPVQTLDILYYILRELQLLGQPAKAGQQSERVEADDRRRKKKIYSDRQDLVREIKRGIKAMKVGKKIDEINSRIARMDQELQQAVQEQMKGDQLQGRSSIQPLGVILLALRQLKPQPASASHDGAANDQGKKGEKDKPHPTSGDVAVNNQEKRREKDKDTLATYDVEKTARKLKEHMEMVQEHGQRQGVERSPAIVLHNTQYETIIRKVFPFLIPNKKADLDQGTRSATSNNTLGEDQIKEIVNRVLEEMHQGKYVSKLATGSSSNPGQNQNPDDDAVKETINALCEETKKKTRIIKRKIKQQLVINGIADRIRNSLKGERTLIILKADKKQIPWEKTRDALSMLDHRVDGAVIVTANMIETYCYPLSQEPIHYSLVGLYHDIVLQLKNQQKNEARNYIAKTLHDILDKCKPHEFCMKIFAHALYINPKRSNEELSKLHNTLEAVSPKSLDALAPKMIKFSYRDLPKECKSCFLYLAIFPQGWKIRRSTLIGRWVAEGLVTTDDWSWSSSVLKAEQCFDTLIKRWLVCPADIGATGEVKSCMVDNLVHDFITKIAKKQRIVETRLSHHLARHFSIFNDLRLRGSDTIGKFLENLSLSSQSPLLKVLDLEGCNCFSGKNKRYLKDICCKILLLKYLSLRKTDVTQLPNEINNLHELEVLDIRQTKVPSTRHVRLLKLKRLLAGHVDPSSRSTETDRTVRTEEVCSCVHIPEKIENMVDMEILSGVKPKNHQDLKDIGALCQLRKLGVVIKDKDTHLHYLLEAISNLHESLRSLSITLLSTTESEGTNSNRCFLLHNAARRGLPSSKIGSSLKDWPQVLETLSISGTSQNVHLLQIILAKHGNVLSKVTLSNTSINQCDLEVLARLPKLCCVRLRHISCSESKLTFKKDEFRSLKYFLFEGPKTTGINFEAGAIPSLEEIVLSFTIESLPDREEHESINNTATNATTAATITGVDTSSNLEELDFNNNTSNTTNATPITAAATNNPAASATATTNTITTTPGATVTTDTNTAATGTNYTPNPTTTADTNTITTATNANTMATNTTLAATKTNTAIVLATNANTAAATPSASAVTDTNIANTTDTTNPTSATTIDNNNMLHSLLENAKRIAKVTLRGTMLKQDGLHILANKPSICCLILLDKSYAESKLTFKKDEFPKLNLLIIDCSNITNINFTGESSPKLEKIVWNFMNMESLSGIDNLPRLKKLEFNGNTICKEFKEAIEKHKNRSCSTL